MNDGKTLEDNGNSFSLTQKSARKFSKTKKKDLSFVVFFLQMEEKK